MGSLFSTSIREDERDRKFAKKKVDSSVGKVIQKAGKVRYLPVHFLAVGLLLSATAFGEVARFIY